MTPEEREGFLAETRTCRIGTSDANGNAHVSALWFVWVDGVLWLNSVVKSQRWTNLMRNPHASVLIDDGYDFLELRGLEMIGRVDVVGEVPRGGEANNELLAPEEAYGKKYGGGQFTYDGRHAWLKLVPEKIVSWDFRKMTAR